MRAGWVELGSTGGVGGVAGLGLVVGHDLSTEEVVAWGKGGGKGAAVLAAVGKELVDGPLSTAQTILADLGPDGTVTVAGGGGNVDGDGTLVGGSNDVVTSGVVVPAAWLAKVHSDCYDIWSTNHSKVIESPPFTDTFFGTARLFTLQLIWGPVMSLTGLLFGGERMYWLRPSPWKAPLT